MLDSREVGEKIRREIVADGNRRQLMSSTSSVSLQKVLVTCTQTHVVLVDPISATLRPRLGSQCQHRRIHNVYVENKSNCMNRSHPLVVNIDPIDANPRTDAIILISCASFNEDLIHERVFSTHMDIQISLSADGSLNVELVERDVLLVAARYAVPTLCQVTSEDGGDLKILQLTDVGGCVVSSEISPFVRKLTDHGTAYSARLNSSIFAGMAASQIQCSMVACGESCINVGQLIN
ncbi:hypothetical protein RB195_002315 [Necator americanus]|uniref:Uncharacterized protein n=1 Tax=Necator americanus TaxID=51031 RepID=A0ABR1DIF6_NECAM